jgi:hypothetical protein
VPADINAGGRRGTNSVDQETILTMTASDGIKRHGRPAFQSIVKEVTKIIEMDVIEPIDPNTLTPEQKKSIIPSSMFLKEKYTAEGEFDTMKARLVAGGHRQDSLPVTDTSSPTVSLTAIMTVLSIAASNRRVIATLDVGNAYLNAEMPADTEVFMRLDAIPSAIASKLDLRFSRYIAENGSQIVRLKKALYGCLQSALLWYKHLSNILSKLGFTHNDYDHCVFNKGKDDQQITVVVYVDDLLITCKSEDQIQQLIKELSKEFKEIKSTIGGSKFNYLGMLISIDSITNKLHVSMPKYIDDLLEYAEIEGVATTPATANLFKIREDSPVLSKFKKERFHTMVAKTLYLAKRVRPELLGAVSFLASRVTAPTVDDMDKLIRMIQYLNYTREYVLTLGGKWKGKSPILIVYIDASHGTHSDGMRGQTGVIIFLEGCAGAIYCKSSKQKINTKSSSESELVGVSDGLSESIWCRNFLIGQGYIMLPLVLNQDNMSTIRMIINGKSSSERTRHIEARFFFAHDRLSKKELVLKHCPDPEMVADLLTKPLQGSLFQKFVEILLGNKF